MKYYARVDSNPDSETYRQPWSLHRLDFQDDILERFDRDKQAWVDNPGLLAVTGIGGSHDYVEVTEDVARGLMRQWAESFNPFDPIQDVLVE